MSRHIFLTGEIQIGKSTALRRFLLQSGMTADGFMSHIVDTADGTRTLYLARYDSVFGETESQVAARVTPPDGFTVRTDVFDAFGADIIARAGNRDLIIMDELGRMEEQAERFKAAVFRKLDSREKRVIGVVKQVQTPFLDAVRARPDVRVIEVTRNNRDAIPNLLAELLRGE
ncbi:MAG: nucleoside-triphosphatase [Oscillospiraceae bacterium]|jgi:nucleoside-triphosphatase|nr:nucleoside-triphosphatase [Oscillospiraceae bacterium]